MSRPAELNARRSGCEPRRRCRRWTCEHCGPIRAGDEHRKFQDNIAAYGGRVVLVAVTAPGAGEGLPWDPDLCELQAAHKHRGDRGCRVVRDLAQEWNEDASDAAALAARYLAQNAAGYLAGYLELASLPGRALRSYVSRRLTSKTGVTIRNLRRVRYLFVVIRQDLPLPEWPEAELEVIWRLLAESVARRGP